MHALIILTLWGLICTPMANATPPKSLPNGSTQGLLWLKTAYASNWPTAPLKHISAGQVEQESSWNTHATLKTSRELGRGLCQMTVTKSFNIYLSAVRYKALRGWDWRADPYNPQYQLDFLVLQDKDNFDACKAVSPEEQWKMTLVSYNAGSGRISARRRYAIAKGLPHDRWTNGLELAHGPLENSVLYGRPLWKAVNEYPQVIFSKAQKYVGLI